MRVVSAMSVAVLLGPAASAAVTTTDLNPDMPFLLGQVLDINNDGRPDLELLGLEGHEGPEGSEYHWMHTYASGRERAEVSLTRLAFGELIGPNLPWGSVLRTSGSEHRHGEGGFFRWLPESPTDTTPWYFGVRFTDTSGGLHFAWARYELYDIRPDLIHRARLTAVGWETQPGVAITAGAAVPSPWSGLVLVVSAAAASRRRRPSAA